MPDAVTMTPRPMPFDKTTSALDPEPVVEVNLAMKKLAERHMTMIVVTHELDIAAPAGERTRKSLRKHLAGAT